MSKNDTSSHPNDSPVHHVGERGGGAAHTAIVGGGAVSGVGHRQGVMDRLDASTSSVAKHKKKDKQVSSLYTHSHDTTQGDKREREREREKEVY